MPRRSARPRTNLSRSEPLGLYQEGRVIAVPPKRHGWPLVAALLALLVPAQVAAAADGPAVLEIKFVYHDPQTGAETPVDSPGPQWFEGKTRIRVGEPYSQADADKDLSDFLTVHGMLCREVRPEPVPGGACVVYVFEKRPRAWFVRVIAREGSPSIDSTELMEQAVKLRKDAPVTLAAAGADRWAIVEHLRKDGYHFAVADARIEPVENRAGFVDVTFVVDRGPKVQPETITFVGNHVFSRGELLGMMQTKEDAWLTSRRFVQSKYEQDIENIKTHYLAQGWEDVEVKRRPVLIDPEFVSIRVTCQERGGRQVVTGLRIRGAETVARSVIREQFLTRSGREFTRGQFDRDIEWLRARYYEAGFRADSRDVSVHSEEPGRGWHEHRAEIIFGKARETVLVDITLARGDGGKTVVEKVEHRATGPFPNRQIADLSGLRPGSDFQEDDLLRAAAAVSRFYALPGHDYALLESHYERTPAGYTARLEFMKKGSAACIRIQVEEGGRYVVESVSFEGVELVFEDHIRDRLVMKQGSLFTQKDFAADIETVRTVYLEKGYADVTVTPKYEARAGRKVFDLTYVVEPGPLCYVDLIRPRGNDKTKAVVITREMAIEPGDRYDIRKVEESVRRLNNLRYFDRVEVRTADSRRAEPGKRYKDLEVQVREASTRRLLIGVGASSAVGAFGRLGYQDINADLGDTGSWSDFVSGSAFVGGGQTLAVILQPGTDASEFAVHWREPWLHDRPVELGVSAGYFSRDWDEYAVNQLGGSVTLGKRYQPTLTGFVGLRLHLAKVTDISNTAATEVWDDRGSQAVLGLSAGVTRDTIDNKAWPSSGKRWTLMAELIGTPFFDAIKLLAKGRWYTTVYEAPDKTRQVVSLWGNAGVIAGSDLPVFERFYAGGLGSVRGFATHGISPLNKRIYVAPPGGATIPVRTGDQIGGKFLMEGGAEYLFPIVKDRVRGLVFLDAGSVAADSLGVGTAVSDLRVSAGVGLHIVLPQLGNQPIALYLGVPLKKESGDDTEAFAFSLGFMLP